MTRSILVALLTLSVAIPVVAQSGRLQTPPLAPESLVGRDSFNLYCASCHGPSGRGDGPIASALRTRPADLTVLARRNRGTFPRDRVTAFVDGSSRALPAHGTTDMPVWGPIFHALDASDARALVRLINLVAYVESLQAVDDVVARSAPSAAPDGAELFRSYCVTCHGPAGRGDGALSGQLRRMPPDLTKFTTRNGGVFPSERVRRIIDGRDVMAHGDRSMPVWGSVFSRQQGADDAAAAARIEALVAFLQSIQERPAE